MMLTPDVSSYIYFPSLKFKEVIIDDGILQNRESFRENINGVENSRRNIGLKKDTISVKAKRMKKMK